MDHALTAVSQYAQSNPDNSYRPDELLSPLLVDVLPGEVGTIDDWSLTFFLSPGDRRASGRRTLPSGASIPGEVAVVISSYKNKSRTPDVVIGVLG